MLIVQLTKFSSYFLFLLIYLFLYVATEIVPLELMKEKIKEILKLESMNNKYHTALYHRKKKKTKNSLSDKKTYG